MKVEILGDGCSKCRALRNKVEMAVAELGIEAEISSVMDPERIAELHAMSLPQIAVDGKVISPHCVKSLEGIKDALDKRCC